MVTKPRKPGARYTAPKRGVLLTVDIPDGASPALREGLARRRLVATTGRCPCGAVLELPDLIPGALTVAAVEHEPNCPATDEAIAEAIEGWQP